MKILWLNNFAIPAIAEEIGLPIVPVGGWLTGCLNNLVDFEEVELVIVLPQNIRNGVIKGITGALRYFAFYQKKPSLYKYDSKLEIVFKEIVNEIKPDIVHIWGTEYSMSLAMMNAFNKPFNTVVFIQGLISACAKHYYSGLPANVVNNYSFRDLLLRDNIKQQAIKFNKRGDFEIQTLKKSVHVLGRTDWDKAFINIINPNARYYKCNETLRDIFYQNEWCVQNCERHTIFMSQGWYPIKGLHFMLEALIEIRKRYPDVRLRLAGSDRKNRDFRSRLRISYYEKYLFKIIKENHLEENIDFLGVLDDKKMNQNYLRCHVFALPSSVENSPNSLGEAMLLGMPCVAADVGGVSTLLTHREEGFLYPFDEPNMLAYYICRIFAEDDIAIEIGKNARIHAKKTHDARSNAENLVGIYRSIIELETKRNNV